MDEGWFKVYRKIMDHWIFADAENFKAWFSIIALCNHAPKKVLIRGELIECNVGQSVMSIESWAKVFGKKWSVQRVRAFFELLKKDGMITTEGMKYTTRLSVCNYSTYQSQQQADNELPTNSELTEPELLTTNKNVKNYKNDKEVKRERFVKPTGQEVLEYCKEKGYPDYSENFIAHYNSNGWKIGYAKMVDWKSAVIKWNLRDKKSTFQPKPVEQVETPDQAVARLAREDMQKRKDAGWI